MRMRSMSRPSAVIGAVAVAAALVVGGPAGMANSAPVPAWLHYGPTTTYPSIGGTWQYGYWDAAVRSYYWINRCHGSTVVLNGTSQRSINTAGGYPSSAELWAINTSGASDSYYYRVC